MQLEFLVTEFVCLKTYKLCYLNTVDWTDTSAIYYTITTLVSTSEARASVILLLPSIFRRFTITLQIPSLHL